MHMLLFLYICDMKSAGFVFLLLVFFQFDLSGENHYNWKRIDSTFDSIAGYMEHVAFNDGDRQELAPLIREMYRIAKQKNSPALLARSCYWDTSIQLTLNRDSAFSLIHKALEMTDSVGYVYDYARMLLVKADLLRSKGDWLQAYQICKRAESCFRQCKDTFYLGKTYVIIGVILRELQEYETALDYLMKGEEAFRRVDNKICVTKNRLNISNTLYNLGRKSDAVAILDSLVRDPAARSDTAFLVNTLVSFYSISDRVERKYVSEAYRLSLKSGNRQLVSMTQVTMGAYMLMSQQYDSAVHYYKKAYGDFVYNSYKSNLFPILCGLSEAYSRLNQPDSAYHYLKEYEICRDSLLARDKVLEVNRLESKAAIEKYESDVRQAEEKARWQTKVTYLVAGSLAALSILIFYILWLSRKKQKILKQLKEVENRELMLQNQQFMGEIDSKNRELTSNTLVIAEKNLILKSLQQDVEELAGQGVLRPKEANALKNKIREHLVRGDEWQYFKLHFENVHPHFFTKLKEICPTLSENDLRLCAYIRIGMSTKQLALMLSVLPDTIITTRYRIRKKLGLSQDESLEDFLRTLHFTPPNSPCPDCDN